MQFASQIHLKMIGVHVSIGSKIEALLLFLFFVPTDLPASKESKATREPHLGTHQHQWQSPTPKDLHTVRNVLN